MKFYPRLIVAVILALVLAEVSADAVNMFLILLIAGTVLSRWQRFSALADLISKVGG